MPRTSRLEAGPQSLARSLQALPELGLRVAWLKDELEAGGPVARIAPPLDALLGRAHAGASGPRTALLPLVLAVVQLRDSAVVWALRSEAQRSALLDLERLLRQAPQEPLVDREDQVPDYGSGRELTVGERRTMARRPTRLQVERLLLDPHPLVIEQLLRCPALTEEDVLRVVTRRPARLPALLSVVQFPRWMSRHRIRLALVLNPGCPQNIAVPLLSACRRDDLKLVIETTTLHPTVRTVAHELLQKLPPRIAAEDGMIH